MKELIVLFNTYLEDDYFIVLFNILIIFVTCTIFKFANQDISCCYLEVVCLETLLSNFIIFPFVKDLFSSSFNSMIISDNRVF